MRTIAALYVDPLGPYPKMAGVECWDNSRNARLYDGPHPVVAHPPCGPWGAMRHLSRLQDASLGPVAVAQVRRWGGALEQPAGSRLWAACNIPEPFTEGDEHGFSIMVEQVAWGHVARKRTLIYVVGVERSWVVANIRTGGEPTHWVSGGRNPNRKGKGGLVPPGIKVCSAAQRRRTPPLFAEFLVELARRSHV